MDIDLDIDLDLDQDLDLDLGADLELDNMYNLIIATINLHVKEVSGNYFEEVQIKVFKAVGGISNQSYHQMLFHVLSCFILYLG